MRIDFEHRVYAIAKPVFRAYYHAARELLPLGEHRDFHFADALDAALKTIAAGELAHARGRARGDQRTGRKRGHAGEEADVLAQGADHVAGVRAHRELAVLLDPDRQVLRIVDLVARHDPRPEASEGVEALADVAGVVPAASPRVALAEVPEDRVADNVLERLLLAVVPRGAADYGAQLALEVHVLGDPRQHDRTARAD